MIIVVVIIIPISVWMSSYDLCYNFKHATCNCKWTCAYQRYQAGYACTAHSMIRPTLCWLFYVVSQWSKRLYAMCLLCVMFVYVKYTSFSDPQPFHCIPHTHTHCTAHDIRTSLPLPPFLVFLLFLFVSLPHSTNKSCRFRITWRIRCPYSSSTWRRGGWASLIWTSQASGTEILLSIRYPPLTRGERPPFFYLVLVCAAATFTCNYATVLHVTVWESIPTPIVYAYVFFFGNVYIEPILISDFFCSQAHTAIRIIQAYNIPWLCMCICHSRKSISTVQHQYNNSNTPRTIEKSSNN